MYIDLNADLGEGGLFDKELISIISSASISCGAHAGDTHTITSAIEMAADSRVHIGAHPSYPDRENFGRRTMSISSESLRSHLLMQLEEFYTLTAQLRATVRHIKPHGALYNDASDNIALARLFASIVQEYDASLTVVGLAGGALIQAAKEIGLETMEEVFADRAYTAHGRLLPRSDRRALISDPEHACQQSLSMIRHGFVETVEGGRAEVKADTLCIHGDSPQSLALARALKKSFDNNGVGIGSAPL